MWPSVRISLRMQLCLQGGTRRYVNHLLDGLLGQCVNEYTYSGKEILRRTFELRKPVL
jgi:hypothetical protein